MKEKEAKEFIEDTLNDYNSVNLGEEDSLYPFFKATERSVGGRVAYEMIQRFEKGEDLSNNYNLGKNKSKWGGIPFSFNKISSNIWIPKNYIKKVQIYDPSLEGFEIFDQDEYNALSHVESEEKKNLIMKVLYCKNENREKIGEKFDLFINNSSWRDEAKRYSRLLLETMNKNFKDNKYLEMFYDTSSERAKKGLKAIDLITSLYLNEMK